ncbi:MULTISPECIES: hypothetical protein [unclassified Rhodococcus (in: high G+C Gram-positive bacteria)]|uniref:hypothetical protein n=1 Tax=unclassified Rhodococcus (in: high G+C Gram-positive bacteria) TaxID=192944 RepID=UPI00117A6530|nr:MULTISPECIES: hypothetical protein [unclassified Rhodococcus (in: high G+C Gram-positive bacteria)]
MLTDVVTGGSRADSRAVRGVETTPTPDWMADELNAAAEDDVLDAEVVEDPPSQLPARCERAAPAFAPAAQPSGGLMDYEEALSQLRATAPPPAPVASRRRRH